MTDQNNRIHNQITELLSAYIDGEVTAEDRALIEAHLATCTVCEYDLATLRQTVALLGQLPQVTASRPFTLRESDVMPLRPARLHLPRGPGWRGHRRPVWWRLPWVQGVAAAAAVLLCVVAVGGVLLLGRVGMGGAPAAAPAPVALQAPASTEAAEEEVAKEAEKVVEAPAPVSTPAAEYSEDEEAGRAPGPVTEAPAEAPAEEVAAEAESLADVGEAGPPAAASPPQATASPQAMVSATAAPTLTREAAPAAGQGVAEERATAEAVQSPVGTPAPSPEALAAASALLDVEDVAIEIEPGLVRVSGRLPLPEGRRLTAELWRDGRLTDWITPGEQPITVGAGGQFSFDLQPPPAAMDLDLFAIEPASYEIRIRPVDPPGPEEARIPFDTYGPAPSEPTEPSSKYSKEEAQATPTSARTWDAGTGEPALANAPTAAPSSKGEVPPAATAAAGAPRNTMLLVGLCGIGVVVALLAGLASVFFFRARR